MRWLSPVKMSARRVTKKVLRAHRRTRPMPKALESSSLDSRRKWWKRKPPTGVAGAVFWLALWFGLLWLLRQVPSVGNPLLGWMQILVGFALIGLAIPLTWRLLRKRLLWSLRNQLLLTYLLIGLAPVVLFLTLVTISAYIAAGQFSIHLADTRMRQQLDEIGVENSVRASRIARILRDRAEGPVHSQGRPGPQHRPGPVTPGAASAASPAATGQTAAQVASEVAAPTAALGEAAPDPLLARLHRHTSVYLNGAPLSAALAIAQPAANGAQPAPTQQLATTPESTSGSQLAAPLGLPPWAADLHGNQFRGLVLDGQDLFLVAIDQRHVDRNQLLSVITSLPVDAALIDVVAQGLGRVRVSGLMTGGPGTPATSDANSTARSIGRRSLGNDIQRTSVYGGAEPVAVNFCDLGIPFVSTMEITDWDTNLPDNVPVEVHSRPSLLYRELFGHSLGGIVTSYIRNGLVALCILFALIEAIALWMARRLSLTITASVAELYAATQRVDRGDFVHRIAAVSGGQQDQLGDLARSFNRMTGSLERLLIEEQEKERLQSELTIAQEVQANLFHTVFTRSE